MQAIKQSRVILFILISCFCSSLALAKNAKAEVSADTLFANFYLIEPVTFSLTNNGTGSVFLPNTAPWRIVSHGKTVFSPYALQIITELRPGETLRWSWDQRSYTSEQVPSGKYKVVFDSVNARAPFIITQQLGSRGFFTFDIVGESLRVYMSNPESIRDAIDNFYGKNHANIPVGLLVDDRPGNSPYDDQWSWHMDPPSITMAEAAIELCDGVPSYVEANLDYWLQSVRYYCPWAAQVQALK